MLTHADYNKSLSNNQFWSSVFMIAACLVLFMVFPSGNAGQKFTGQIFFLILIPAAYIKLILKKNLSDYGINIRNKRAGLFWGIFTLAAVLSATYAIVNYTNFADSYALPGYVVDNFWYFLLYELAFVNISIICFEFFLRGFILSTLSSKISYWAIPVQSLAYLFILIYSKNNSGQITYAMSLSLILGFVAWRTKSIAYSYAIILVSSVIIDAYLIYSIK